MEQQLAEVMGILEELVSDNNISKTIKKTFNDVILVLNDDFELPVKCDKAIQILTLNECPAIDAFTKTRIWSLLSLLESIS